MSKMGDELERKLDENKYEMYESLKELVKVCREVSYTHAELKRAREVLTAIAGKDNVK